MWALYPQPPRPFFPVGNTSNAATPPFPLAVCAHSWGPPRGSPSSTPQKNKQKQIKKQEQEGQEQQQQKAGLSGLDVLWAMQQAAAEKGKGSGLVGARKKNKKKRDLSSAGAQMEDGAVDFSSVRPLCIKSDWGVRLDQLEKRHKDLSETK